MFFRLLTSTHSTSPAHPLCSDSNYSLETSVNTSMAAREISQFPRERAHNLKPDHKF